MCVHLGGSHQPALASACMHIYTHKAPAPSVSDMGELNDRGRKAKEKAFSSCLSFPPSLHFSSLPSLSFSTALSNINAPYGAFWTGFFFLNSSWPGTQSIRHPDVHLLAHQLYSFNEGNLAQALEHTEKIHTPLHYCIYNKRPENKVMKFPVSAVEPTSTQTYKKTLKLILS